MDQANYLNEKALGSICTWWDVARVPVVLVGTALLHDVFFSSRLTEDVRAQLSRRVAMHYPLAELTVAQCKSILKRAIPDLTDEEVSQIVSLTGSIHGHLEAIITRILDLRKRNEAELKAGTIKMDALIRTAGSKLMIA